MIFFKKKLIFGVHGILVSMLILVPFVVAAPKQIRELMNVDGLTNDEVKSHLQILLNTCNYFLSII